MNRPQELLTVGHGTASEQALRATLEEAGVELLVDVRRYPGSSAHPHVRRDALQVWLPEAGVSYRWEPRLGGRRRLPRDVPAVDTWWTVEAFAAYAAHTRTPEFAEALEELLADAASRTVTMLCSEAVWWRCHRRLIADVAVLTRGVPVRHLVGGSVRTHVPSAGARAGPDGTLVWDGPRE